MKIQMKVKMLNTGVVFIEDYDINNKLNPSEYAQDLIKNFNNTLKPGESPRELLCVEVLDNTNPPTNHQWEKQNLVTIMGRNGSHDKMKCANCGITGKRYGFNPVVTDSKYKAKVYDNCESAIVQLKRLEERRNSLEK